MRAADIGGGAEGAMKQATFASVAWDKKIVPQHVVYES